MEIINKLRIDDMVKLPNFIILIRDICNGACLACRLSAKILIGQLTMRAIKLRVAYPVCGKCLEVFYVFFFPS